tara:strand:+ start:9693 stop:10526 length:834 start_codon:yes stop_codon:yes gene_type:complete
MKEETERKKYRELSIAEITKFIKLMSKKKFKYEDYVKSEEDWWDLTNFVAQFGNNNSPRTMWLKLADKNEATREWLGEYSCGDSGLESAIADIFFSSEGGQSSYRNYWPQGRRQSFTYKYNRIISAIQHFHRMELRNPDRDHGYMYGSRTCFRKSFDITSLWVSQHRHYGSIDNGYLGVADAKDIEEALMQFKMFVYPLIGLTEDNPDITRVETSWKCYVSQEQKLDAYIVLNGELIKKRTEHNDSHDQALHDIQKRIDFNNRIIETARGNLLANMA